MPLQPRWPAAAQHLLPMLLAALLLLSVGPGYAAGQSLSSSRAEGTQGATPACRSADTNCVRCDSSDPSKCAGCGPLYSLDQGGTCVSDRELCQTIDPNCLRCKQGACKVCQPGFIFYNSVCTPYKEAICRTIVDPHCTACSLGASWKAPLVCSQCDKGYKVDPAGSGKCVVDPTADWLECSTAETSSPPCSFAASCNPSCGLPAGCSTSLTNNINCLARKEDGKQYRVVSRSPVCGFGCSVDADCPSGYFCAATPAVAPRCFGIGSLCLLPVRYSLACSPGPQQIPTSCPA